MSFKPFPVVPFHEGLERDKEPFLLPDDAFPDIVNCDLYLGRIEKKLGNRSLDKSNAHHYPTRIVERTTSKGGFIIPVGTTGASPFTGNLITPVAPLANLGISPGSVIVTIAAPVGPRTYVDNAIGGLVDGAGNTGTVNYVTGAVVINHPAGGASVVTATYDYYPGRPVMGLLTEETILLNREELKGFDTRKANLFSNALQRFVDISVTTTGNAIQWNGTNSDFFWGCNYYHDTNGNILFWATNNIPNRVNGGGDIEDGIQIYNGTGWAAQRPVVDAAANELRGCLLLISYRGRLVALNTIEGAAPPAATTRYSNRARWSQSGVPYTSILGGFEVNAWRSDIIGRGGFIDAPTSEQIVSCGFYKDTLIVFFERSTWQLFYNGNPALPFAWQRINTQFGCESTFSVVGFDKGIFAIGNTAIITSDSVNVERIDLKIPEEVFSFHNQNDGPKRVHGIRDFYWQFVYWTFPDEKAQTDPQYSPYPNKVLAMNYRDGSYAFYKDSYTCYGYFQSIFDNTWAQNTIPWSTARWRWDAFKEQADYPAVVAGNQQGFVVMTEQQVLNDPTLFIVNVTQAAEAVVTSYSHNLQVNQFALFTMKNGMVGLDNLVGKIKSVTPDTITVDINTLGMAAYTIGGLMTVIDNFDVYTKRFNPFYQASQKVRASYADFYVFNTANGAFTVDVFVDDITQPSVTDFVVTTTQNYGPSGFAEKTWQRSYIDCMGQYLQLRFYFSDSQIRKSDYTMADPVQSAIRIDALNMWMAPSGRLFSYDTI